MNELLAELRRQIADERVLAAIAAIDRSRFVPPHLLDRAYANEPLPIGGGQTISQPLVVARMCELLDVRPGELVLDVGTGSGWHAAVLAQLGASVIGLERDPELAMLARAHGIEVVVGDGYRGLPDRAPFDAINVAAAAPGEALRRLEGQLAVGGRLVAPLAEGDDQRLVVIRRLDDGSFARRRLEPVRFVPLVPGAARREA